MRDTNDKTIVAEYEEVELSPEVEDTEFILPSGVEIKDTEEELSGEELEKLQHELELSGLLKVNTLG